MEHCKFVRQWADLYRGLGLNPLPASMRRKAPMMQTYRHERDNGCPSSEWAGKWGDDLGIQLATGCRWRLLAIDIDGPEAKQVWRSWSELQDAPDTWMAESGSGKSEHVYYRIPDGIHSIRSRSSLSALWLGGGKHSMIESIADRGLIVAPPSLHQATGRPYRWRVGPWELSRPAIAPPWVLNLAMGPPPRKYWPRTTRQERCTLNQVCDPVGIAMSWGLRVVAREPNHAGWYRCRSIYREDRNPSAMFHHRGIYWESGVRLWLPDLGVELGQFLTREDCIKWLAKDK